MFEHPGNSGVGQQEQSFLSVSAVFKFKEGENYGFNNEEQRPKTR